MTEFEAIRIIRPEQFDFGTAQTPGSERRAAIAPELGITSALWGGIFEVEPGSRTAPSPARDDLSRLRPKAPKASFVIAQPR